MQYQHDREDVSLRDSYEFFRGCNGKKAYPSKKVATGTARQMIDKLHAYKCRFCKLWHLGH